MKYEKQKIREIYIEKRNLLKEDEIKLNSEKIWQKILKTHQFKKAESIFIFMSFGKEVYTRDFILECINLGKKVCIPIIKKERKMEFYLIKDIKNLNKNRFGFLEPKEENIFKANEKTLVIVPALVYSKENFRIGYGGGYYDRFLAENKIMASFGVCFNQFILNYIPKEKFDIKVDCVFDEI